MPSPISRWCTVQGDQLDDVVNGRRIPAPGGAEGMACGIGPDDDLLALLEAVEDGRSWHPRKVFSR